MSNKRKWKKIVLQVWGDVRVSVSSPLVIEVPSDTTDEEIDQLPTETVRWLAEHANQWENGNGLPEEASYVEPNGGFEFDDDVEEEKAQCRLIRATDGQLVMEEENGTQQS